MDFGNPMLEDRHDFTTQEYERQVIYPAPTPTSSARPLMIKPISTSAESPFISAVSTSAGRMYTQPGLVRPRAG